MYNSCLPHVVAECYALKKWVIAQINEIPSVINALDQQRLLYIKVKN